MNFSLETGQFKEHEESTQARLTPQPEMRDAFQLNKAPWKKHLVLLLLE